MIHSVNNSFFRLFIVDKPEARSFTANRSQARINEVQFFANSLYIGGNLQRFIPELHEH